MKEKSEAGRGGAKGKADGREIGGVEGKDLCAVSFFPSVGVHFQAQLEHRTRASKRYVWLISSLLFFH
jgi:hypothetical protein